MCSTRVTQQPSIAETLVHAPAFAIEDVLAVGGDLHEDERVGLVMLGLRALDTVRVAPYADRK